jgi:hypothetical protein
MKTDVMDMRLRLNMRSELVAVLFLLFSEVVVGDMSDVDQVDSQSDTSSTSDFSSLKEGGDPNLVNPQRGQGYGMDLNQQQWRSTTPPAKNALPTTPKPTFAQESARAMLEFGIIVGVAFMVGGMFMAMVGLEILLDKVADKYREFFKKPKILPDVERLHPAELVGTFSRYK